MPEVKAPEVEPVVVQPEAVAPEAVEAPVDAAPVVDDASVRLDPAEVAARLNKTEEEHGIEVTVHLDVDPNDPRLVVPAGPLPSLDD
jgi:hypothetical protein